MRWRSWRWRRGCRRRDRPAGAATAGRPPPRRSPARRPPGAGLRRLAGGLASLLLGLCAVVLLIVFFNSRDGAGVDPANDGSRAVPGQAFDAPQQYLDAEQLRLLRAGNVYVVSGSARPVAPLQALRQRLSGPPDPVLERAGQAVVLVQRSGTDGVVALAAGHRLVTQNPADPRLDAFASHWLGRGAG